MSTISIPRLLLYRVLMTSLLTLSFAALRHDVGVLQRNTVDAIFTQNVLWTSRVSSRTQCAVECIFDELCVSFAIWQPYSESDTKRCRGYSVQGQNLTESTWMPGARLYCLQDRALAASSTPWSLSTTSPATFPTSTTATAASTTSITTVSASWLQKPCSRNADCPNSQTACECFAQRCLCSPGFYYSTKGNNCVESCEEVDLQPVLIEYPSYYITVNNIYQDPQQSMEWCKEKCRKTSACRSMDYDFSMPLCTGANVTPREVPSDWIYSRDKMHTYFQKTCA